jgi:hypothetical protein
MLRLIFIALVLSQVGCAQLRQATNQNILGPRSSASTKDRLESREEMHDRMVGLTEDQLIMEVGMPTAVENVSSFKVYIYVSDRGASINGGGIGTPLYGGTTIVNTSTSVRRHFQQSRFYFLNGRVVKWDYGQQ